MFESRWGAGWLAGCLAWLPGCLSCWLAGLAGWRAGSRAAWLAGCLLALKKNPRDTQGFPRVPKSLQTAPRDTPSSPQGPKKQPRDTPQDPKIARCPRIVLGILLLWDPGVLSGKSLGYQNLNSCNFSNLNGILICWFFMFLVFCVIL